MLMAIMNTLGPKWAQDTTPLPQHTKETGKDNFSSLLVEADAKTLAEIAPGTATQSAAVQTFMEYQNMSMAEKIRMAYLSSKNITEEELQAMEPKEREKIENDIREAIKRKLDPSQA